MTSIPAARSVTASSPSPVNATTTCRNVVGPVTNRISMRSAPPAPSSVMTWTIVGFIGPSCMTLPATSGLGRATLPAAHSKTTGLPALGSLISIHHKVAHEDVERRRAPDSTYASGVRGLEIDVLVADHETRRAVNRPVAHRLQEHSGGRLTAIADTAVSADALGGMMRAIIERIDMGTINGEIFIDPAM